MNRRAHCVSDIWKRIEIQEPHECWFWVGKKDVDGYGRFSIENKDWSSHRAAYEAIYGKIPSGMIVCHRCDNPPCCNPYHLYAGTVRDNTRDAMDRGRKTKGMAINTSKLTDEMVKNIRGCYALGLYSHGQLAKKYGVYKSTITMLLNRKNWKHIP